jgi:hypothetical protein
MQHFPKSDITVENLFFHTDRPLTRRLNVADAITIDYFETTGPQADTAITMLPA